MMVGIKNTTVVNDVIEFIQVFDLEEQFCKDYDLKSLDEWWEKYDDVTDMEVINKYLDQRNELFFVYFNDEGNGTFEIYELSFKVN